MIYDLNRENCVKEVMIYDINREIYRMNNEIYWKIREQDGARVTSIAAVRIV